MLKENDFKKEMTAEDKKKQRDAKAAEKKARAEAAAAKKAGQPLLPSSVNANPGKTKQNKKPAPDGKKPENSIEETASKPQEIPKKEEEKIIQKEEKAETDEKDKFLDFVVTAAVNAPKSALKVRACDPGDDKEIKFDLTLYESDKKNNNEHNEPNEYHPPYSRVPIDVHHAFVTLNNRCENDQITEIDELCKEFITACKQMYADFFAETFQITRVGHKKKVPLLNRQIEYILENGKWSLPPALNNLFRMTRRQLQKIEEELPPADAAELVLDELESLESTFLNTAHKLIVFHLESKLTKAKRIVVYKGNKFIENSYEILVKRNISVCVVEDEFTQCEAKSSAIDLAVNLAAKGIHVTLTDMKGIARVLSHASLLVLPSNAVFLNGGVSCPKGGHQLAEVAKHFNVPVVICAQAYKFVDLVQHIGRTALLRKQNSEIIPSQFITALITEIRILPPSSAPAVIKAKIGDLSLVI